MKQTTSELIYGYLQTFIGERGFAPTLREISSHCHVSRSTVVYHLNKLENMGWLVREASTARGLRLLRESHPVLSK